MGLRYAAVHMLIHFLFPFTVSYFFRISLLQFIIVLASAVIIDLDHLSLVKRYGIRGAFRKVVLKGFSKVRKYPLHNFAILTVSALSAFVFLYEGFFIAGMFSLAIFFHLIWDLLEDVVIFKVGIDHWKV
jgi:prepilin signal peptidase PulO-like enzyme (type II secretory pathway)